MKIKKMLEVFKQRFCHENFRESEKVENPE